jgi:STE24 endopeptidase
MEGHRFGLPIAVGIAVVAAGAATFLLRPRTGQIDPAPVAAEAYFSPSELDRARDYRGPQRALGIAGLVIEGGTLALLALRPPRRLRRALERGSRRPILVAAAAGGGLAVVLTVVGLPLSAVAEQRARDVGLSTQDWGSWTGDIGKATAISVVMTAGGAAILMGLIRRFPRSWFGPGAAAVVGLSAVFLLFAPVVIDPLFNRFDRLPQGEVRSEVLALADRADVDVGEVYRVDASRRTTGANAYVGGLGHTKRVVLYDTLLREFPADQIASVVAHELGHVKHRDIPRGLLWLAIVAPAGTFLVQRLTERLAPEARGGRRAGPAVLPAAALAIALVGFSLNIAGNAMSREVEQSSDGYALDLHRDPAAFIGLHRRLAVQNVSDPDPPDWVILLFGTHPETVDRIGHALSWARTR